MNANHKIKIVFTGCVGAGKTTAIATISEIDPVSTDVNRPGFHRCETDRNQRCKT